MRKSRAVLVFAKTAAALENALRLVKIRTDPYFNNQFFQAHPKTSGRELVHYAQNIAETLVEDTRFNGIGKPYFELLLAGYSDYVRRRHVSPENIFVRNFRRAIQEGRFDAGLGYLLENEASLLEKVEKKFLDMSDAAAGKWNLVPPILVKTGDGPHRFTDVSGRQITAENIDGHHRFFIAQLLSQPTIDALLGEPAPLARKTLHKESELG
jgi:hypothetical protein